MSESGVHYEDALPIGTRVGSAVLGGAIGQGGEGIVYIAEDPRFGRVIVKEYWPKLIVSRSTSGQVTASQSRWQSALRDGSRNFEALGRRLCALPTHHNVVEFHDVIAANQTVYLLMQHLSGAPLSVLLDEARPLPPEQVQTLARQLCAGLAHLHSLGLIHRDVAPDNVIVDQGRAVLIDLNAAKDEERQVSLSLNGLVKPGYSPFEQYAQSTGELDARSDIYATSAVLIHAITGQKPREAAARMQNRDELDGGLAAALPGFDRAFLAAIRHGFALFKQDRPASIAAWQAELFPAETLVVPKPPSRLLGAAMALAKKPVVPAALAGALAVLGLVAWQPWSHPPGGTSAGYGGASPSSYNPPTTDASGLVVPTSSSPPGPVPSAPTNPPLPTIAAQHQIGPPPVPQNQTQGSGNCRTEAYTETVMQDVQVQKTREETFTESVSRPIRKTGTASFDLETLETAAERRNQCENGAWPILPSWLESFTCSAGEQLVDDKAVCTCTTGSRSCTAVLTATCTSQVRRTRQVPYTTTEQRPVQVQRTRQVCN